MDRKSKKSHKSETRNFEKEQGKHLQASAERVEDQAEVKKVRDRKRGGTADAERDIQSHLNSAKDGLQRSFKQESDRAKEAGSKAEKAAEADRAERDTNYQESRELGDAAAKVKHGETKKELGKVRDTHAKDAVFFNEQRKERERIVKQGQRIGKELEAKMRKLAGGSSDSAKAEAPKSEGSGKVKVEWTHPETGEKFIHKEKGDGVKHLYYGPPDTKDEKRHGHAVFDEHGKVKFNRNPKED